MQFHYFLVVKDGWCDFNIGTQIKINICSCYLEIEHMVDSKDRTQQSWGATAFHIVLKFKLVKYYRRINIWNALLLLYLKIVNQNFELSWGYFPFLENGRIIVHVPALVEKVNRFPAVSFFECYLFWLSRNCLPPSSVHAVVIFNRSMCQALG